MDAKNNYNESSSIINIQFIVFGAFSPLLARIKSLANLDFYSSYVKARLFHPKKGAWPWRLMT